jgi:hypothetical protein
VPEGSDWLTVKLSVSGVAALKLTLPGWVAVIEQVAALRAARIVRRSAAAALLNPFIVSRT